MTRIDIIQKKAILANFGDFDTQKSSNCLFLPFDANDQIKQLLVFLKQLLVFSDKFSHKPKQLLVFLKQLLVFAIF